MSTATSHSYLRASALTASVLLLLVAAFNLLIDPFGLYRLASIDGINRDKPEQNTHVRLWKAHRIRLTEPSGLILGSSRAEYGLDPEHPGWNVDGVVFNAALPSGSVYEALQYLRHAQAVHPLEKVVLGLDLFMFNATQVTQPDFVPGRLQEPGAAPLSTGWFRDLAISLWSIDALEASWNTVLGQARPDHVPYLTNGMRHPERNRLRIVRKGGHHAAFASNERYSLVADDGWAKFDRRPEHVAADSPMDSFRELIDFCREQGIDLYLFISPVHARKLEVLWQFGLWEEFEDWKRDLVGVLAEDERNHPRSRPYALWDFSGFNSVTTEPVPPAGDTETVMHYYWEGSHYRKEVGDRILNLLFGKAAAPPDGFGTPLTERNLEPTLNAIRDGREAFAVKYPEIIQEISKLIEDTQGIWRALRTDRRTPIAGH